jgi:5-methylcytosine-specific restriction protein A
MRNPPWTSDEIILALDLYFRLEWKEMEPTSPAVIELSNILHSLPHLGGNTRVEKNFRNPNSVSMKLQNFKALDPRYGGSGLGRGSKLDRELFESFQKDTILLRARAAQLRRILTSNFNSAISEPTNDDPLFTATEGSIIFGLHRSRERNATLSKRKRAAVLASTGKLECEVCAFDFESFYGKLGLEFCEVHHTMPLSKLTGQTKTQLKDLSVVCSNCHRMLHRMSEMSIQALKDIIKGR